jgi:7-cyano-7-deazaguanine synthase
MNRPLAVVTLSGGMDSTTALAWTLRTHDAVTLSFDYGQRHRKELDAAKAVAQHYNVEHHTVDLRSVGRLLTGSALTDSSVDVPEGHYAADTMKATVVPNRNAIMASVAIGVASSRDAEHVVLGVHAGDHAVYPDCRPEFLHQLQKLVDVAREGFSSPSVIAPFLRQSKTDIARMGVELDAPLHLTWSCYVGGEKHCGRCGTCVERYEAFRDAGVVDPTSYADDGAFASATLA